MDENGKHLIMDIYTKKDILTDNDELCNMIVEAVKISDNITIQQIKHEFKPFGLTCIALLMESHMSIHTYPEQNYIAIDLYTCGKGDPIKALKYMMDKLEPYKAEVLLIQRGSNTMVFRLDEENVLSLVKS